MWRKEGRVSKYFRSGSVLTNATYINSDNPKQKIELRDIDGCMSINVHEAHPTLIAIQEALSDLKILTKYCVLYISIHLNKPKYLQLSQCLDALEKYLPIAPLKKEILENLNVKDFYSNLSELIAEGKLDEARQKINQIELRTAENLIFHFAKLLKDHGYLNEALDLYQDIPPDNPNYQQANKGAGEILLIYSNDPHLTPQAQEEILQNKIHFMLKADAPDEQNLLDRRFAELSGDQGMELAVTGIGLNEDTLFNLAHQMKMQREEILRLQKENQRLSGDNKAKDDKTEPSSPRRVFCKGRSFSR